MIKTKSKMAKFHIKKDDHPQGGIVKQEAPIHISNVSLIDPKSGKPTRIKIEREGKTVKRIAKKSGEVIK